MTLTDDILNCITPQLAMRAGEIASMIGKPQVEVQKALHDLDDNGRVTMRNGWYQLTAAERERRA